MSGAAGPGSARPERRVPVTPLPRRLRPPRPAPGFPWGAPTWPGGVAGPPVERALGMDYDTAWARRPPARVVRALLGELVTRPVVRALADPEVSGLDRVAHLDGPVIFVANHASHLDTPLLLSVLPERWQQRTVVAGAADYFFDTRLKAAAFALTLNTVPIERQRVSRDSANRLAALLGEGWSLLIFPEGGRSPDGWGQPHRAGAAWLAVRAGRPVVPVHVGGTGRILPRGATRPRPGRTQVTFGRPLAPGEDPRALADATERAVAALADEQATDWWAATRRAAQGRTPPLTGPDAPAWRRAWALDRARPGRAGGHPAGWPRSS